MKKRVLKFLGVALALSMSVTPVMAAEYTQNGTATCVVNATIESSYRVSIPATLSLTYANNTFSGTYNVGAKGNIAGNQYVSIVPDSTLTLTGQTTNATATATISQEKQKWVQADADENSEILIGTSEYAMSTGTVSVDLEQADSYSGSFTFTFSLEDC